MQVVVLTLVSLLPIPIVGAAFWLSRHMPLIWRLTLLLAADILSFLIPFVLLAEFALVWSPTGMPGPGEGILALPMATLWLLTVAVSGVLLLASAMSSRRDRSIVTNK